MMDAHTSLREVSEEKKRETHLQYSSPVSFFPIERNIIEKQKAGAFQPIRDRSIDSLSL